jgi:hypothetical protein
LTGVLGSGLRIGVVGVVASAGILIRFGGPWRSLRRRRPFGLVYLLQIVDNRLNNGLFHRNSFHPRV